MTWPRSLHRLRRRVNLVLGGWRCCDWPGCAEPCTWHAYNSAGLKGCPRHFVGLWSRRWYPPVEVIEPIFEWTEAAFKRSTLKTWDEGMGDELRRCPDPRRDEQA